MVLAITSPSAVSSRKAPGLRSHALTRPWGGTAAEPAEPVRGRSKYSNLSDCHFHGEDRHRCRKAAAFSAGPRGASGPRRFVLSHAAISTVYARGPPGRTNIK
ncbi:hypothetical protein NicSoilC12_10480 [Arthrobacter sp. NicSoilC12]|nr:hypothetical protein NicSoilC12_10480 [Arthrobacter sp. NicSoilC12]